MRVVLFFRKRQHGNFSIESLFRQICKAFPEEVQWEAKTVSFFSQGLFKRLYITLEAMFNQKEVNHITGDINFIALFLRKQRTVLTIHDIGYMNHPIPLARWALLWFWIRLPISRSAIVTVVSSATKNELLKYVKVDPSKIRIIPVPISPLFQPATRKFNKEEPIILQIGTKFNKNVVRLVQALQGIKCRLEIVGKVDEVLLKELESNRIVYKSNMDLTDEEMVEKYKQADIIAFVSTYEGFGMPIIEGNAVGRVVVTSNILSMPEVAGNAAHLVNPYDVKSIRSGILKVIEEDAYRAELIENGFGNRKRFESSSIANQYYEIYKGLAR